MSQPIGPTEPEASIERRSNCRDTVATISKGQQAATRAHRFTPNFVNTIDASIFNAKYPSHMTMPLAVARSARWVSNYANVPRLGLRPSLLLDLAKPQVHATLDTQHAPLVVAGYFKQVAVTERSHLGRDVGFLGSDSNIHAKHPLGTPEGWWILDSDPNKPGRANTVRPPISIGPQLLEGGEDE